MLRAGLTPRPGAFKRQDIYIELTKLYLEVSQTRCFTTGDTNLKLFRFGRGFWRLRLGRRLGRRHHYVRVFVGLKIFFGFGMLLFAELKKPLHNRHPFFAFWCKLFQVTGKAINSAAVTHGNIWTESSNIRHARPNFRSNSLLRGSSKGIAACKNKENADHSSGRKSPLSKTQLRVPRKVDVRILLRSDGNKQAQIPTGLRLFFS